MEFCNIYENHRLLENGRKAANGFAALAELDKNGDGVLDANDAAFAALRVWRDANSDGKVGEGELLTLDELGIQSLGTNYKTQNVTDTKDKDRKSTRLNSSHRSISYAVFCLKKKK